jgi:hypothetical protein
MHNSAKDIFTTFNNGGNWSSVPLAFFIGLQGNALCFVGTDSAVHVILLVTLFTELKANRHRCPKKSEMPVQT